MMPDSLQKMTDTELKACGFDLYQRMDQINQQAAMIQNGLQAVMMEMEKRKHPPASAPTFAPAPAPILPIVKTSDTDELPKVG
jgi:hypothetical protein